MLSSLEPTVFAHESFKLLATGLLTDFKGASVSKSFFFLWLLKVLICQQQDRNVHLEMQALR